MTYRVTAPRLVDGLTVDLPASKSLSNRALIMRALADGPCRLSHLSDCDDTAVMLRAFEPSATSTATADGAYRLVDIGAAGTSMRFLTAYYASTPGLKVVLTGSQRMQQRPIAVLVDALRALGAHIDYVAAEGCPPLRIEGRRLTGGDLSIDGSTSSQYVSALLMIAPTLADGLRLRLTGVVTSTPYIEMTLGMMRAFGVEAQWDRAASLITIAPQRYVGHDYAVESDWSAASYWYEIMALSRDLTSLRLRGLRRDSLQGDSAVADLFAGLGIETRFDAEGAVLTRRAATVPSAVPTPDQTAPNGGLNHATTDQTAPNGGQTPATAGQTIPNGGQNPATAIQKALTDSQPPMTPTQTAPTGRQNPATTGMDCPPADQPDAMSQAIDLSAQPDLAQTIIATCCGLRRPFAISGLHTLRIKETDRVAALEAELAKLGHVVTDETVPRAGSTAPTIMMSYGGPASASDADGAACPDDGGPVIATYQDHRMAMAFAPLCLAAPGGSIRIAHPEVVSKSYPSYWHDLRQAGFVLTEE